MNDGTRNAVPYESRIACSGVGRKISAPRGDGTGCCRSGCLSTRAEPTTCSFSSGAHSSWRKPERWTSCSSPVASQSIAICLSRQPAPVVRWCCPPAAKPKSPCSSTSTTFCSTWVSMARMPAGQYCGPESMSVRFQNAFSFTGARASSPRTCEVVPST